MNKPFEKMTVKELKKYIKDNKLFKGITGLTKTQLLNKIRNPPKVNKPKLRLTLKGLSKPKQTKKPKIPELKLKSLSKPKPIDKEKILAKHIDEVLNPKIKKKKEKDEIIFKGKVKVKNPYKIEFIKKVKLEKKKPVKKVYGRPDFSNIKSNGGFEAFEQLMHIESMIGNIKQYKKPKEKLVNYLSSKVPTKGKPVVQKVNFPTSISGYL